jgi:hypothetical protein
MNLDIQGVSQQAIDAVKSVLAGGGQAYDPTGVRKDITTATGLVAYNLEPAAKLLVPAFSPIRNRVPRVGNTKGGTAVNWKVIQSLDVNKANIFTAEGAKASTINYTAVDRTQAFKTLSAGDNVSFKSQWAGRSFEDVKARAVARLLKTTMVREEYGILGGRNAVLPAVTQPTTATATTGGTIAAATYNVFCRALSYLPGTGTSAKGRFSTAAAQVTTGATSTISATVPWVEGAARYEWYVGVAGSEKLEATTRINSVLLTALAGTGVTKVAVDADANNGASNGGDTLAFNGLLAQLDSTANIVTTLATGTAGIGTVLAQTHLDDLLQNMWDTYRASPDVIYMNSEESINLTNLVLAAGGAPVLQIGNAEKAGVVGNYRVSSWINKATGRIIPIEVHPYLEQGTMLFGTFEMPFPASDIDNPVEIETLQEYLQIDYPPTRTAWEFEVLVDEVIKLFFPGSWGVIRNIARQ